MIECFKDYIYFSVFRELNPVYENEKYRTRVTTKSPSVRTVKWAANILAVETFYNYGIVVVVVVSRGV